MLLEKVLVAIWLFIANVFLNIWSILYSISLSFCGWINFWWYILGLFNYSSVLWRYVFYNAFRPNIINDSCFTINCPCNEIKYRNRMVHLKLSGTLKRRHHSRKVKVGRLIFYIIGLWSWGIWQTIRAPACFSSTKKMGMIIYSLVLSELNKKYICYDNENGVK